MATRKVVTKKPAPQKPAPQIPIDRPAIDNQSQEVFVSFSAEIRPQTCESLLAVMAEQVNRQVRIVHLLLSTPGGSVMNGLNVYNVLKAMPFHLITHNVGNVDSIGNAIFLAGKERLCCDRSTFMFHGVGFDISGNVRMEEKLLRERLDAITSDQRRIGEIIRQHTNLGRETIDSLFLEAKTKDATYARTHGIVHDIREAQITHGSPVIQLVFSR